MNLNRSLAGGFGLVVIVAIAVIGDGTNAATSSPQGTVTASSPVLLEVKGEGVKELKLGRDELQAFPRKAVQALAHDGKEARYEGVSLFDVLARAGVPNGKEFRGKASALYLVVEASDGYRAVFALPELDPAFNDRVILLADHRDGKALGIHEGPLQIIVPGEKRHARWVRQVVALRIARA